MEQSGENGVILHSYINKGWLCGFHYLSFVTFFVPLKERGRVYCFPFFRSSEMGASVSYEGLIYSHYSIYSLLVCDL